MLLLAAGCRTTKELPQTEAAYPSQGLRHIPDAVLQNQHLQYLHLGVQGITAYASLSALPNNRNHISALPDAFCRLTQLQHLNLGYNDLQTLPAQFSQLVNLQHLDLSFNTALNIGTEKIRLYPLRQLKYLNIMGTRFAPADKDSLHQYLGSHVTIITTWEEFIRHGTRKN
jgi:Leucine-rich repeat (LRR) protein